MREIVSRLDAKALGLNRYFTGVPCKYGHVVERWSSSCECVRCNKLRNYHRYHADDGKPREERNAREREYRAANRDVINAASRKRRANRRERELVRRGHIAAVAGTLARVVQPTDAVR